MKIALCTRPLSTASKTRGVGAYTRELISALRSSFPTDDFIETTGNPYSVHADLVHYPFFDPFFLTLPWRFPQPFVVTIHDLIPLKYPTHFPVGKRGRLKWRVQKFLTRRAKAIITDSDSSASDIHSLMGIPQEHIHVVPLASATSRTTLSLIPKLKKLYHLPERYILYVGDVNWNKNLPGLIQAFAKLDNASTHLVLVGKVFADEPNIPEYLAIKAAIADAHKPKLIHRLGYVPSHHLGAIYREATLYCQPSWDEGFGLPVLEAMKAGCPVISSNRGSLKEVGGDAAVYFDPAKDNLTLILESLLASSAKREAIIAAGITQAKKFTWQKTAQLTRDIYQRAINL